ncbi:MAG: NAD(P)/FAD-dependent oxidoreductase [Roseiflexaceae bacterium]
MPHIVILGGGFAGTAVLRHLDRRFRHDSDVAITLISQHNYMVFTPLLAEVAGNSVEPRHAVPPLRAFCHKARFQESTVRGVELQARRVRIEQSDGKQGHLAYDYLVIALGSVTNYHHAPGAQAHSFDLKTLTDAIRLRNHALAMLEQADTCDDADERRELLTFVAAGGGYAGVEGLGQLVDFVQHALPYYPSLKRRDLRFILATHSKELLKNVAPRLGQYVIHALVNRGVDVRTGVSVTAVTEHSADLEPGGTVPTRTVLWAAGIAVNPLAAQLGLPTDQHGAIVVEPTLQVKGHPQIFALGDCAAVPKRTHGTYAPTAQNATRAGTLVAANLTASIHGAVLKPFRYRPIGSLASLGRHQAVAQIAGLTLVGWPAWLAWRAVYLAKLPMFSRRVRVAMDWMLELVLPPDIVQLPLISSVQTVEVTTKQPQELRERSATDPAEKDAVK